MKKLIIYLTASILLLSSCSWKPEKEVVTVEKSNNNLAKEIKIIVIIKYSKLDKLNKKYELSKSLKLEIKLYKQENKICHSIQH